MIPRDSILNGSAILLESFEQYGEHLCEEICFVEGDETMADD